MNCIVEAFDPLVAPNEISLPGKSKMVNELDENRYDAIVVAVAHQEFLDMEIDFVKRLGKKNFVLFDVKSVFDVANVDGALDFLNVRRLNLFLQINIFLPFVVG